jgi:putative transposase
MTIMMTTMTSTTTITRGEGTLRAELVDDERYPTRRSAKTSIGDYIDGFYNVERLHSHLDYVSPIEFELKEHVAAIAA